jgi:hypothetical protein
MGGLNKPSPATTTTNQSSTTNPWAPAQPGLQNILAQGQSLFGSGVGAGVYDGQRVAGFGADSQSGIDALRQLYGGGVSDATAAGTNYVTAGLNGDNPLAQFLQRYGSQNPVTATANQFMSGDRDINTQGMLASLVGRNGVTPEIAQYLRGLGGLTAGALAPTNSEQNLSGVASGQYLNGTNPAFEDALARSSSNAQDAVRARFAASGRYGSGNFAGAIAKSVGDVEAPLRASQYNTERQRQVEANQLLDQIRAQRLGLAGQFQTTGLGAVDTAANRARGLIGDIGNVQGVNNQQRLAGAGLSQSQTGQELTATGQMTNAQLAMLSQLPGLEALRTNPARGMMQLGQLQDQMRQQQIGADMTKFNEQETNPWRQLGLYQSSVQPIAGLGGTSSGTSTQVSTPAQPSLLQQLTGAGLAAAQMYMGMPPTAAMGGGSPTAAAPATTAPSYYQPTPTPYGMPNYSGWGQPAAYPYSDGRSMFGAFW